MNGYERGSNQVLAMFPVGGEYIFRGVARGTELRRSSRSYQGIASEEPTQTFLRLGLRQSPAAADAGNDGQAKPRLSQTKICTRRLIP